MLIYIYIPHIGVGIGSHICERAGLWRLWISSPILVIPDEDASFCLEVVNYLNGIIQIEPGLESTVF